jgi:hypothetical protein
MNPGDPLTANASVAGAERVETDAFVADIARLLMTFFIVVALDLVVVSLLTGQLRFWFPIWLDPQWDTRPDPWVVYSQSYFTGIFLLPLLCRIVDRDFLVELGVPARAVFWSVCAAVFAFVLWWKGSLMLQYHKQYEMLGWAALTLVVWTVIRAAGILPPWIRSLSRRRMLGALLFAIAIFFLVMSVVDPLIQLGVQRLPWSSGLATEIGFFIPAGLVLMVLSRRLAAR